jgi:cytochrome c-type biogenesis protein CcmH
LVVGLAVALPLAALSLYLVYGSPRLPDQPLIARLQDPASDKNLEVLVARVEARLREHPEEGEGWEVIAPVYMGWRRYADAAEAYRQSIRLLGESPNRLASFGQALVLANNGVVTEDARQALERAIVLDPKLIEPRLVLIIAKEQDGQLAAAIEDWRALLANAPADAPWRKLVEQRLAEDEAKLAGQPVPAKPEDVPGAGPQGPSPDDVAAAQSMSPADRQAMIESMVQGLADRLTQNGDDLAGWLKLVRAYTVLDRKDDALKALEKAKIQFSGNADALQQLDSLAAELGLKS